MSLPFERLHHFHAAIILDPIPVIKSVIISMLADHLGLREIMVIKTLGNQFFKRGQ